MICPMKQIIIDLSTLIIILENKNKKKYIDSYSALDSCPCMRENYRRKRWLMCTLKKKKKTEIICSEYMFKVK